MYRKLTVIVVPALLVAMIVLSTDDASQALARGSRGGRSSHAHSRQHHRSRSKGPRKTSASKKKPHHRHHHRHHHRRHHRGFGSDGGFGWDGGGFDGDGDAAEVGAVDPVTVTAPITILNPPEIGTAVSYTLGDSDYSIAPGRSLVHNDGTQVIAFDRGESLGQATYTLQPGTYRFVKTSAGLDLRTVTDQVAATSLADPQ